MVCGKGGTGKTVFSANMAIDAVLSGKKVLLVDAEKGGGAFNYSTREDLKNLDVFEGYSKSLPAMLPMYANTYDLVIVDTSGNEPDLYGSGENFTEVLNHHIISNSDLVIVPVEPPLNSLRKCLSTFSLIERYIDVSRKRLKAMIVINKAEKRGVSTRNARLELKDNTTLPVSDVVIWGSKKIENAEDKYNSVQELFPDSDPAICFKRLENRIYSMLDLEEE